MSVSFCIHGFNSLQMKKNWGKKIPGSSKDENLNLLCVGNYLPFIYIVFTSVYIAFTLH